MARLLEEGRNCWRIARARRAALLVDGASYFEALAAAMERAQQSIYVVGWDLHSRIRLRRREPGASDETLAQLLDRLAASRRRLRIYLLAWDFAMLYALERESLPRVRLGYATHRRVRFRLDGDHPLGASQHQKLVVVDDAVAFAGGLDLAACRWDTPQHEPDDARRCDPGFERYDPFHDVQLAVDGDAAAALGELARERWRRATGERLPRPRRAADPWPEALAPDLRDADVGIARTEPAHDGRPEVREVEALYVDALRAAQRQVYIENQYLSSQRIGEALEELLSRARGPEVVIVGPAECSGWLEEGTMGVLRAQLVERLRKADCGDRLRIYHPVLPDRETRLLVHAKVLVVDDTLLRVGSANLSNRSMGLDTECDLAVEARGRGEIAAGIGGLRNRLLAEHLGVDAGSVAGALRREGSLIAAIEALRGGARSLERLEVEGSAGGEVAQVVGALADPERPIEADAFVARFLPAELEEELEEPAQRAWVRVAVGLLVFAALAGLWRWTPLSELTSADHLSGLAQPLRQSAWGPLAAVGTFTVAGLLMVPVTVLIVATGLVFGGVTGFLTALVGSLTTAAAGYAAGAGLWRDGVRRLMGKRANALSRKLARRGILAMVALRIVPVAPYTVVNVAAGASHIRWRDFLVGTVVGLTPGVLVLTLIADRVTSLWSERELVDVAWILVLVSVFAMGTALARRWLLRLTDRKHDPEG